MARLETAMWRDYYEKRYPALFYHLYDVSRSQFGFSPLDSLRIVHVRRRAARTFQPTRSRQEADAALPELVTYYGLLLQQAAPAVRCAGGCTARARLVAGAGARPWGRSSYGLTVAEVAALTYGKPPRRPGVAAVRHRRAEAMAFRDARGTDDDGRGSGPKSSGGSGRLPVAQDRRRRVDRHTKKPRQTPGLSGLSREEISTSRRPGHPS